MPKPAPLSRAAWATFLRTSRPRSDRGPGARAAGPLAGRLRRQRLFHATAQTRSFGSPARGISCKLRFSWPLPATGSSQSTSTPRAGASRPDGRGSPAGSVRSRAGRRPTCGPGSTTVPFSDCAACRAPRSSGSSPAGTARPTPGSPSCSNPTAARGGCGSRCATRPAPGRRFTVQEISVAPDAAPRPADAPLGRRIGDLLVALLRARQARPGEPWPRAGGRGPGGPSLRPARHPAESALPRRARGAHGHRPRQIRAPHGHRLARAPRADDRPPDRLRRSPGGRPAAPRPAAAGRRRPLCRTPRPGAFGLLGPGRRARGPAAARQPAHLRRT